MRWKKLFGQKSLLFMLHLPLPHNQVCVSLRKREIKSILDMWKNRMKSKEVIETFSILGFCHDKCIKQKENFQKK